MVCIISNIHLQLHCIRIISDLQRVKKWYDVERSRRGSHKGGERPLQIVLFKHLTEDFVGP